MRKDIDKIRAIIEDKAASYGFRTEQTASSFLPEIQGDVVGFRVWMDNGNPASKEYSVNVRVASHIVKTGGSPTPGELLKAADEIARAACLTAELQAMALSFGQEELGRFCAE